ncbi:putative ribonuclease H-like domain-containing protein [Tanacetum coccineum]
MKKMYCLVVIDDYNRFSWVFFLATKDETSGVLKSFITRVENLIDQRVKVIRCDNRVKFKNEDMNQFCERKGIKREFSVARTPQQNGVAKRKNRTLIKVARTMLADFKLPTTFWAEAVNTASLGFMRPFGYPITILNTVDHLGKFDGKADERFFVGYLINSKAIRVFKRRTRIVEENLHVQFSENIPNIVGSTKACDDAGKARRETVPGKDYIMLPLWPADPLLSQNSKSSPDDGFKPSGDNEKKVTEEPGKEGGDPSNKNDNVTSNNNINNVINGNNTNKVNTVSLTVNTAVIEVNAISSNSIQLPDDLNMPKLEDIIYSDDAKDVGAEADMNNLNTCMPVRPILTTRIHKDHPVEQIIADLNSEPQTRRMTKNLKEHEESKEVIHALKDPSWIEALLDELLQFKLQKVFRNKKDERGIVIKNKARLVTQGNTQEEGNDYDEVFAPVARIEAIRLFLAYASFKDFVERIFKKRTKRKPKASNSKHGVEKGKCMRTRSKARRLRQQQQQQQVPPNLVETPKDTMADNRTMAELLQAPTEGYEDAIVVPESKQPI